MTPHLLHQRLGCRHYVLPTPLPRPFAQPWPRVEAAALAPKAEVEAPLLRAQPPRTSQVPRCWTSSRNHRQSPAQLLWPPALQPRGPSSPPQLDTTLRTREPSSPLRLLFSLVAPPSAFFSLLLQPLSLGAAPPLSLQLLLWPRVRVPPPGDAFQPLLPRVLLLPALGLHQGANAAVPLRAECGHVCPHWSVATVANHFHESPQPPSERAQTHREGCGPLEESPLENGRSHCWMLAVVAEWAEVAQASAAGYRCGGHCYLRKCPLWVAPAYGRWLLLCQWSAALPKAVTQCRQPPHRAAWLSHCACFETGPQRHLSLSDWCGSEDQMVVSPISWTVSAVHDGVDH
mmetsp:Transcript_109651/g.189717  ORF Transcript_109651/g.189717 Transcript_109651/m.189717 type:complete len:345 (+) Transcript_109651:393-1427(+)